jgi:hypothetical protein
MNSRILHSKLLCDNNLLFFRCPEWLANRLWFETASSWSTFTGIVSMTKTPPLHQQLTVKARIGEFWKKVARPIFATEA